MSKYYEISVKDNRGETGFALGIRFIGLIFYAQDTSTESEMCRWDGLER